MFTKTKKAFTIVELVIVIAVIAILMGIMFVGGTAISNNAKESSLGSDFRTFETNVKAMINDPSGNVIATTTGGVTTGFNPTTGDALALIQKYFEGDMKLGATWSSADTLKTGANVSRAAHEVALADMNDPYGVPYNFVVLDDSDTDITDITFIVYSYGKNKQSINATADGLFDKDDTGIVIRVVDSVIYTGTFAKATTDDDGIAYKDAVDAVAHP